MSEATEPRRLVGVRIIGDPERVAGNTQVYVDGVLVPRLQGVTFEHWVGDLPHVWLQLAPDFVEIEAQAEIHRTTPAVKDPR